MTTFLVLFVAYTLSQFYRAFLAIVAGELTRTLGLNAADLGSISAIWFASFALAQFPVGFALDRFGPRRTLAAFMVLAVIGAALFARADDFADCLVAMALIGIGCSPVLMASLYVFGRAYPPERFAMLSSLIIGLGSVGNLLGATPLALAIQAFGWRAAMGGIAALTALAVLLALLALRDPPRVEGARHASALQGLAGIASIRPLWFLLPLTFVGYAVVIATRSLWIAPFFAEVHGFGITERGNAALVMGTAMSLGALAYGPIERAIGSPKRTTLLGTLVTGAAYLALGFFGDRNASLALVILAVIGASGLTYGILMAHARAFFPENLLGRGVTFMNFAFIGGAGVIQWLSGRFVQAGREAGTAPDLVYGHLHSAFGVALLAAAAIYALSPPKPGGGGRPAPTPPEPSP